MTARDGNATDARREALGAALVATLGVGLRLAFVRAFPTIPVSDFRVLVEFGTRLRDHGLAAPGFGWVQFNPGLPLLLSVLFRIFPSDPEGAARAATAVLTGLTGLVPLFAWRPILGFRWRLSAALALALWPGQVFFSGVVAQENWALLPAVAVACLGVRGARAPELRPRPIVAGLLYAAACAIRQELLVVLLPLVLPAAGAWPRRSGAARRLVALAVSAGVPLLLLAAERREATGRFALTTEHGGLGLLGSVVPGAAADGWIDPKPYVAARRPELLRDRAALRKAAAGLALDDWRRRWRYDAFRAGVSSLRLLGESDAENLFWSVGAAEVLPSERRAAAEAFAARWGPLLRLELAGITGLFAAAVLAGVRRRDRAILLLAAAVLLKVAVQALVSPMGRLMVPAIALEILGAVLGAAALAGSPARVKAGLLGIAAAAAAFLLLATPPLRALARRKDEAPPRVRQFPLEVAGGGFAECRVESGRIAALGWRLARVAIEPPGASARVTCALPEGRGPLRLRLDDAGARSADTRVEADGRALSASAPGDPTRSAPRDVALGDARSVTLEIRAAPPPLDAAPSVAFEIGAP